MARLIGQLSNSEITANTLELLISDEPAFPAQMASPTCGCSCGQPVPSDRKFVNQEHYDRSKGIRGDLIGDVVAKYQHGMSAKQLAAEYRVAHATMYRLLRRMGPA